MSNGHVEVHDLLSTHSSRPDVSSDADSMADTVEFRLMMAYAHRRRPKPDAHSHTNGGPAVKEVANGSAPCQKPEQPEEEKTTSTIKKQRKKKKKGWKRLPSIFRCIKPQNEEAEDPQVAAHTEHEDGDRLWSPACIEPQGPTREDKPEDALGEVVSRLSEIIDDIPFIPPDIEPDAPEENHSEEVEAMIGLLLRDAGDRLYEQELKDANIAAELFWNYSFFRSLVNALLTRMGLRSRDPDAPGPHASPKTQIAVTCEVTSRLSALDTLPMSRLLDHGARYLQDYYSPWIQKQGGYEAAFEEDDEDEVQ